MKIYLATWLLEANQGESLTKMKKFNRLTSFHFLKQQGIQKQDLEEYVDTGKFKKQ